MKLKLKLLLSLYCLLVLSLAFLSIGATEALEETPVIKITSPKPILFDLSNLKPGDTMNRLLTVQNNGNVDFNYSLKSEFKSGSAMFYNQLLLQVSDDNGILYDGKLSDFTGFEKTRFLALQTEEDLALRVEFPWESGNEFQGLATSFRIILTAEGKGSPPGPPTDPPGSTDPPTDGETPSDGDPPTNGDSPKDPNPPINGDRPTDLDPTNSLTESPTPTTDPLLDQAEDEMFGRQSIDDQDANPKLEPQAGIPSILPKTGEINPAYFLITGLLISFVGTVLISIRRFAKRNKEF